MSESHEARYMRDRAGDFYAPAIGLARLALGQGDAARALRVLDDYCDRADAAHRAALIADGFDPSFIERFLGAPRGTTDAGHSPRPPDPDPAVRLLEVEAERDESPMAYQRGYDNAMALAGRAVGRLEREQRELRVRGERLEEALRAIAEGDEDWSWHRIRTNAAIARAALKAYAGSPGPAGPVAETGQP